MSLGLLYVRDVSFGEAAPANTSADAGTPDMRCLNHVRALFASWLRLSDVVADNYRCRLMVTSTLNSNSESALLRRLAASPTRDPWRARARERDADPSLLGPSALVMVSDRPQLQDAPWRTQLSVSAAE